MHSALFVAIKAQSQGWEDFLGRVEAKLSPDGNAQHYSESCVRLAENVWLLNLTKSVEPLGWLTSMAQVTGVYFGLLTFDAAPQWLPADFQPRQWK